MRVVERITGTAGCYVITGALCRDENGRYVARATAYLLTATSSGRPLRSVATANGTGAALEAVGATASEAKARLCVAAKEQLDASVTSLVWHPAVFLALASRRNTLPRRVT
jgi:hypothetical protein